MNSIELLDGYQYRVDDISKDEWHTLLLQFDDATVYQTWSYGAVHWGEENLSHILLVKEQQTIAAAQVRLYRIPVFGLCIAYIARGPIWRRKDKNGDHNNLRQMLRALNYEYVSKRNMYINVVPNESDSVEITKLFLDEGFKGSRSAAPYRSFFIDLQHPIDDLYQGLSKKWRENLRRAKRGNMVITEGTSNKLFESFIALYQEMHARKKFAEFVDVYEFFKIQKDLPESLKMHVMISELDGSPVSTLVYSTMGNTGVTIFSATANAGLKSRGSYLLRWSMLERIKTRGFQIFDQGGVNIKNNPGGYHFKSGMGGEEKILIGTFFYCENIVFVVLIKLAEIARASFRKLKILLAKLRKAIFNK